MWSCSEIRSAARERIRPSLWSAVFVTFVYMAMISAVPMITSIISMIPSIIMRTNPDSFREMFSLMMMIPFISVPLNMIGIALVFFFYNPLAVGYVHFLDGLRSEPSDIGKGVKSLFWPFREGRFSRVMAVTAWKYLWLMIWSYATYLFISIPTLVAIVIIAARFLVRYRDSESPYFTEANPEFFSREFTGLIMFFVIYLFFVVIVISVVMLNRKYAYMFTEYICADEPDIAAKDALNKSKSMTKGLKGNMFLLDLSFIGWHIVSAFTFGLLSYWLHPYITTAFHEVYLRKKAELRPVSEKLTFENINPEPSAVMQTEQSNEQQ